MPEEEIKLRIKELNGWGTDGSRITKTYVFTDFKGAMSFVNKVAEVAEREDHHPDIYISYNKVGIILWTHSVNGLSLNDFIVAAKIDNLS